MQFSLFDDADWHERTWPPEKPGFRWRRKRVASEHLGSSPYELAPGESTFPYHYELGPIRLAAVVVAAAVGAGATAENARAALFFFIAPTTATPGDVVMVRTGGTPESFTLRQRVEPLRRPIRLYLVANRLAPDVHSRFDRRAHFVGRLVPDVKGRGLLRFTVPPIDSDS